jgi:DNA-binding CsgD family transcriptional regulator
MASPSNEAATTLLGRGRECEALDAVLADALANRSRVLVLRGEAGTGKSALLDYVTSRVADWHVATAGGVESEMELAYSGLHQLCRSMLADFDRLPAPQRSALATVFGRDSGPTPDPFLVGLATLTLLAEVAERQPLVCIVDDAQWLDAASARILGFVARRLLAERIAFVCAARTGIGDGVLDGLPVLSIGGLRESDARALLLANVRGPLDAAVAQQIIADSHGNPLALIELPRTWRRADLAGGFGLPASRGVDSKIEQSYAERLLRLPAETQTLVVAAAAEPLGDPVLLHRAVETLGLDMAAAGPAVDAGLLAVGGRVGFTHPLARSAAYRSAGGDDRRRVHGALAEATDPERDPDRRAWHRARATGEPDEEVAAELERSAGRAQARGGVAAAAAFLERAAELTPDPVVRTRRVLAAADAKEVAGAPQAALALVATARDISLDEREGALARRLQGEIDLDLRRIGDAVPSLLEAAGRLESIEPRIARDTYLDAIRAAHTGGRFAGELLRRAAQAARDAPPPRGAPDAFDVLLAGMALRFTDGYVAGAPLLKRALRAVRDEERKAVQDVRWPRFARVATLELFDDGACDAICARAVQLARERGALGVLPLGLNYLAICRSIEGDLATATALLDEADAIADATAATRIEFARFPLAGYRGDDVALAELIAAVEPVAIARGEGVLLTFADHARALLYNGLGRYEAALPVAESASAPDELTVPTWSLPELVEAAARSGAGEAAAAALERLTERTQAAGTELALGIEARCRALVAEGAAADELYREAVDRLGRCRLAPDHARAHLLHGEWLRSEGRDADAREPLRTAHEMLEAMGVEAFAHRARRELLAAGGVVPTRAAPARDDLTPQEAQIAALAAEGYTNPEIGAQLFLSPRTVEWHLHKVFAKLDISSRKSLGAALESANA